MNCGNWNIEVLSFSEKGKKNNNEDALYFDVNESKLRSLFLVCDGVGGLNKGEVASNLVCKSISDFILLYPNSHVKNWVDDAIKFVEKRFDETFLNDGDTIGMASTLALMNFRSNDILVAHCGDSRVYQFRNKRILFKTKDHSYVNWLIERGEISKEQARVHPKKNVITRCISGTKNSTVAEENILNDIKSGDFILLCTDGLLDAWSDKELSELMTPDNDIQNISKSLKFKCDSLSQDNFSAILINIK